MLFPNGMCPDDDDTGRDGGGGGDGEGSLSVQLQAIAFPNGWCLVLKRAIYGVIPHFCDTGKMKGEPDGEAGDNGELGVDD